MPAVDLRALVKNAVTLTGKIGARANGGHAVHEGIARDRSYATTGGKPIFLPASGTGMYRVKSTLGDPIPGVPDHLWNEARVRLLGEGMPVHRAAGVVTHGPDGALLSEEDRARARSTLLTAVFRAEDESFSDGTFSSPRFGAVATMTVLPHPSEPKWSEDAWLTVEWAHSTSAMLRTLARLDGVTLEPAKVNRPVKILIAENLWSLADDVESGVLDTAYLCGARPTIHLLQEERYGAIRTDLGDNQPSQLLVLGTNVDEKTVSAFTSRRGERDLHRGEVTSLPELDEWLREFLPHLMGIGPGLTPHPEVEPEPGRPRLPVLIAAACLHHTVNGKVVHYVLDRDSKIWWTRDFARHGTAKGTEFKSYKQKNDNLEWEGDHRADSSLITMKRKSDKGIEMEGSKSSSCAFPESHLH